MKCKKKIYLYLLVVILLIFTTYFSFVPRYQICHGYSYPTRIREHNCLELDYSLGEILSIYPNFRPPMCACGEFHSFSNAESASYLKALAKNKLNRFTNNVSTKVYYDYNSNELGLPLVSSFLNLLPTQGTFYIGGNFLEIKEHGFTIIEPFACTTSVYLLDEKYADIPLESLRKEHFVKIRELNLTEEPAIITLPFGTYLFSYGYVYYVLSIQQN